MTYLILIVAVLTLAQKTSGRAAVIAQNVAVVVLTGLALLAHALESGWL